MRRLMLIGMRAEPTQGMALVPVWGRGWFWSALSLLTMLPFFVAPLPMMPDLFSHMARYHVMNFGHESAFLRQYYDFEWQLVGNLGVDLLMVPLGHILPTEVAAKYLVMLIPPLTVAGIYSVAISANGRITAPALMALPFVFSFTFMYGFLNYHLAVALAMLVFAWWIRAAAWSIRRRWLVFLPAAALVWLVHMAGWAVLLVLVAGWELPAVRASGTRCLNTALATVLKTAPLAMPALLTLLWRSDTPSLGSKWVPSLSYKVEWLMTALRAENVWLDLASMILLGGVALALLILRSPRAPGLFFAALLLGILMLALPTVVFFSAYADARLVPVAAIMFFIGMIGAPGRTQTLIAMFALGLFGARIATITVGWHRRGIDLVADLRAIETIPRGSRIAMLTASSGCDTWALKGFDHVGSLAVVRREAFTNSYWDLPGQSLMRPAYNSGRDFNDVLSSLFTGPRTACGARPFAERLAALPRDRFDYVWIFGAEANRSWLELRFSGPNGRFYRIKPVR